MLPEICSLNGKVAIVTGASRGIGAAIAEKFASRGADVAIIYAGNEKKASEVAEICRRNGTKAQEYKCDVSNAASVESTIHQILSAFGRCDILVNNAGITKDSLLMRMHDEDFDRVMDVNLRGAFLMMKNLCPIFLKQKGGKIINISSVTALSGNPGQANYTAAKAGLIALTKTMAKELGSRGICCNAIAPGFIETDMTDSLPEETWKKAIPMRRIGQAGEVADLALFLASSMSDYITGEVIRIDGGLAM